jgi:hypothetical protein
METFSDNMQLIGLELFDAAFAVPPGTEDDVKRRFMTLFVHESDRRRGGSAEVLRASNMLGESFALKRLHLDKRDAGATPQGTPVRKELRHSASSGSDTFGTPDYVTQGHMSAFY